jgi:glucose-6-phosphate isomerase
VWYNGAVQVTLSNDLPSSSGLAARFARENVLARLKVLDAKARRHGLGGLQAGRNPLIDIGMETAADGSVTKNSYGVLNLSWQAAQHPEWSEAIALELQVIQQGLRAAHDAPLRFLIWAGMGGSAEDKSMYSAVGLFKKGPRVYVLDSTDPAKLKAILGDMTARSKGSPAAALRSTVVVGMAMGMTSYEPVVNLQKLAALYDKHALDSRANFFYMTLAGSLLDQFASSRGYRRVELQMDGGNSTAGRHSGPLTRGSLYPLGLAGVDLAAWIKASVLDEVEIDAAWRLAAFLHQQGLAGRDKVTLLLPKALAGIGVWTKQNVEESLGKSEELGIKIIIGEKIRLAGYPRPTDPRQDRVFLAIQAKGALVEKSKLHAVRRSYPTAVLALDAGAPLSRYMQFLHYAVFGLGYLRSMNFVTQPSVELYKAITSPLARQAEKAGGIEKTAEWQGFRNSPRQTRWRGGVVFHYDRLPATYSPAGASAAEQYAALLSQLTLSRTVEYGELTFFGDTRYAPSGLKLRRVLDKAAEGVFRAGLKIPVDVYEGPAMNHSYHEMIIGHGRCFSTVLLSEKAEKLTEAGYTADYHRAQFLATQMALAQRGRLVVAITVRDLEEASLRALGEFFEEVARRFKAKLR